jgi:hypothetical protein
MKKLTALTLGALLLTSLQTMAAGTCTKQLAVTDAENYVSTHLYDATTLQLVVNEPHDFPPHWSVDLVGSKHEYEIWVRLRDCKIVKAILQPL